MGLRFYQEELVLVVVVIVEVVSLTPKQERRHLPKMFQKLPEKEEVFI
jgi:hypothetical protein